ncbi:toprim domain-containing protein [Vulcaniibacterium gelatinicum]|uniref:toprim domain-containing protein n=1 Tax=Vulcaniibacterium gelatinicum TaxID=2598725 RepID=UPI0011C96555|nr:toprim domain-containing protein [Vulcaniibacterium gelatinicum]
MNAAADFTDAARRYGLAIDGPAVGDGAVHRVHVEGDRRGSRNGWYLLHLDGVPAGAFGSWKGGWRQTWHAGSASLSTSERMRLDAAVAAAKRRRAAEQRQHWQDAAMAAQAHWCAAGPADAEHPYLRRKGVRAHGIRQSGNVLLVPMRDADGTLWNLQSIAGDGTKRFRTGARKAGTYHAIGGPVCDVLLIAEGYATAASLHEASGLPVAVAFDCGNLAPVARALRAKYPHARITLCADNDTGTPGNPGLTKARAAAVEVQGYVAIPPEGFNDFNDAARGVAA